MTIPNLPTPGSLFDLFLKLSLGPGAVLSLIMLMLALRSWYQTFQTAYEKGRIVANSTRTAVNHMRQMHRAALAIAAISTLITLLAQGIWLVVNYIIGNLLSALLGVNYALHNTPADYIPSWSQFFHSLQLDPVSAGYLIASAVAIIASYIPATRGLSKVIGQVFAIPGYIYGFCGLAGGLLTLILFVFHVHAGFITAAWIILMLGAGVVACFYVVSCFMVITASEMVSNLWSDA